MSNSEYTYKQAVEELQRHGILRYSAEKALEALQKMSAPLAKVLRDGQLVRLETDRAAKCASSAWGTAGAVRRFLWNLRKSAGHPVFFPSISDREPNKTTGGK